MARLDQKLINEVKQRVLTVLIVNAVRQNKAKVPIHHLIFPEPGNYDVYQLHEGNPPPRSKLPKWLRGAHLALDVPSIPPSVRDGIEHLEELYRANAMDYGNPMTDINAKALLKGMLFDE